jgi:hypothetical protein
MKDEENKPTLGFTDVPQTLNLQFFDSDGIIGRFYEKDGKLHFEGDVNESAEQFVEYVIKTYNKKNCGC